MAATFRLLDVTGRVVAEAVGNPSEFKWKLEGMVAGVYFLVICAKQFIETRRVVF